MSISNNYNHDRVVVIDPINMGIIGCGSEEWYLKNKEAIHDKLKETIVVERSEQDESDTMKQELRNGRYVIQEGF